MTCKLMENVWSEVKRLVRERRPQTAKQIERYTKAAWKRVTSDRPYVDALFSSISRRLQAVMAASGGAIDY